MPKANLIFDRRPACGMRAAYLYTGEGRAKDAIGGLNPMTGHSPNQRRGTGMAPNEIRAELVLRGVKIKEIARLAGVSHSAVSQTIRDYGNRYKGRRIRPFIALALNKKESEIWPGDDDPAA